MTNLIAVSAWFSEQWCDRSIQESGFVYSMDLRQSPPSAYDMSCKSDTSLPAVIIVSRMISYCIIINCLQYIGIELIVWNITRISSVACNTILGSDETPHLKGVCIAKFSPSPISS